MFLVAGLAVAGLVGIAAAFYFSIRSGNRRDKRLRSAGAGRAGAARRPGGRTSTARPDLTRPDLNGHPPRAVNGSGPVTMFRPAAWARFSMPKVVIMVVAIPFTMASGLPTLKVSRVDRSFHGIP